MFRFRCNSLRFCQVPVVSRGPRFPHLLQDLRPNFALQRQEQVDRRGQETQA